MNLNVCSRVVVVIGTASFLVASAVAAEKPAVDRVFPSGGQRGTTVEVKLNGKPGDVPLQAWSDQSELKIVVSEDRSTASINIPADAAPGLHRLRFWNEAGATDLLPFLVGVVSEQAEAEPNNLPTEAQAIQDHAVVLNGVLQKSGDVDVYQVSGRPGRTLVTSVVANETLGSPMDAVLQVLDSAGTVIAQNDDDHNFDPQVAVPMNSDQPMFVRIFAFPAQPNSTIRFSGAASYVYRLTLTSEAFVDHTMPLCVESESTNEVRLHGWNLTAEDQRYALDAVTPPAVVIAGKFSNSYRLPVGDMAVQVEDAEADATAVELPVVVSGCIHQDRQQDTVTFAGTKGQKLNVQVDARDLYSLLDPVVQIKGPDGKVLKEADDVSRENLDVALDVTLKVDGPHSVTVTDRYASGSSRHFYAMRLAAPAVATFAGAISKNAVQLTEADTADIEVQVDRKKGFAEAITMTVQGLPEGVSVQPVVSEKEGDSAKKVTLQLKREASMTARFSGPIRIVATAADQAERLVQAPIANSSDTTGDLWLTVAARPEAAAAEQKAAATEQAAK